MPLSGSEGNRGGLVGFCRGPPRVVVFGFNAVDTAATIFNIPKSTPISFFQVSSALIYQQPKPASLDWKQSDTERESRRRKN
jgi:hypothetical protein